MGKLDTIKEGGEYSVNDILVDANGNPLEGKPVEDDAQPKAGQVVPGSNSAPEPTKVPSAKK